MDCSKCNTKSCREVSLCNAIKFPAKEVLKEYKSSDNQVIVQTAAKLVDNGRAGTLSRLQEIIEFCKLMNYCKIGIAYCYGMENDLKAVVKVIRDNNITVVPVSCTTGGFAQSSVNELSEINKVSCNPIAQAAQLNEEKVDLTLTMGLCLGHDILFNRYIESDVTAFVVKDRVFNHAPLNAVKS